MSTNQLVLVPQETRTVLTASFLKSPKLRKWSIEQGNLWETAAQNAQIRTLLDEQRQMIIAECCEKIGHHELQQLTQKKSADSFKDSYGNRNWNFVKLINKWRNYENSKVLPSIRSKDESSSKTRTLLFWNYQAEYKNKRNEVNCMILMKDSKDFQDLSSQWKIPTLPVNQCHSHLIRYLKLRHFFASPCRREGPPSIWVTHGISGNVFANPHASSSAPHPQELNQWNSSIEERFMERSERPEQNQDLRCQSGPSAKNAVIFSGGDSLKNDGADQQRLQISDLHFDKFPAPATFASWKTRF